MIPFIQSSKIGKINNMLFGDAYTNGKITKKSKGIINKIFRVVVTPSENTGK